MAKEDCPNLENCPYPELTAKVSEDCWKLMYCYNDSMQGYENCARFKHKELKGEAPPKELLPDGSISK